AIGGARVTHDKKTSRFRWNTLNSNGTITLRDDIVPAPYSKTKPSFLIGLNYKPNDDTLIYGKWSNSFVSGGSVAGIGFEPETASSFELGLKADFLDRKLRTNLALFYVDYKHFQQPSSTTSPEAVAFLNAQYGNIGTALASNLSTFVQQAHDVRAKGFELEVTAAPTRGLTIGGSLAYTDAEFLNILPTFLASQGGEYVPFVRPKWTGSAYFSLNTEPLFGNAFLNFRMDALYTSEQLFTATPNVRRAQGFPENSLANPAKVNLNGRIALRDIDIGGAKAELSVWGRNLTDRQGMVSNLYLPFVTSANYEPARTYGVELSIEF
ncbi:MAG: TonB-dependent receptor, partial [Novosphingobium sp.]